MSKIKVGGFVEQVLRKAGRFTAEKKQIIEALNALDVEMEESEINEILDDFIPQSEILTNSKVVDELNKMKSKTKAEVLDGIDKGVLNQYVALLPEGEKQDFNKLPNTIEKVKYVISYLEGQKGDKESQRQVRSLQDEISRLSTEITEKYVPKSDLEKLASEKEKLSSNVVKANIIAAAKTNANLTDTSNNRFFEKNFVDDFTSTFLSKKGATIDPFTLELLDNEGNKVLEKGKSISIKDAVDTFIDASEDWKKKSNPTPTNTVTTTTARKDLFDKMTPAQKSNFQKLQQIK